MKRQDWKKKMLFQLVVVFYLSERLQIFFAVLANSDYNRDNVTSEPVAHRLYGNY